MNNLSLFNLCNYSISLNTIMKLWKGFLTIDEINNLSIDELGLKYNIKKKDVLENIKNSISLIDNTPLSIYALAVNGISERIINILLDKDIKYIFEFNLLSDDYLTEIGISDSIIKKIRTALEYDYSIDMNDCYINDYISKLENDEIYIEGLERKLLKLLPDDYISDSELLDNVESYYKYGHIFDKALNRLIDKGYIEVSLFGIKKQPLNLDEFIFSLPKDKNSFILIDYLNGLDLDKIQEKYEVSRQNAKQIITKYPLPYVVEEDYLDLYNTYSFTMDEFCKIFGTDSRVYRYIELINKKPRGNRRIIEMLEDPRVSPQTKIRVQNTIGKYAFIHGKSVLKNVSDIFNSFSATIINPMELEEITTEFKKYWFSLFHEELVTSILISNLVTESMKLISSKDGYRYYDISSMDIDVFYNNIKLIRYGDVEISTKYIYDTNLEVMKSFDILDEYELYSILRKTNNRSVMEFSRKPIINLNGGNRNNQIKTLLFELSPVTLADFKKEYSNIFGVNEKSFSNYVTKTFSPYYQNQTFTIPLPELSDNIVSQYKNILVNNFYFVSDIALLANKNNILFYDYFLNKANINKFGFDLYGNYILKSGLSLDEYFNSIIVNNELDLSFLDSRLMTILPFNKLVSDKCNNLELFEYSNNIYYTSKKLNDMGITKNLLLDFINSINEFVYEDDIFTIDSLINKGFTHKLLEFNLPKLFYSSVLKTSNNFIYKRNLFLNEYIFRTSKANSLSFINLIEQIIEPKYYMYLEDIIKDLNKLYGISISSNKLLQYLNSSNIYYNDESNLYYLNYEAYRKMR